MPHYKTTFPPHLIRLGWTAVFVVAYFSLTGCDVPVYENALDHVYSPNEKTRPEELLQISGEVDPTIKVEFTVIYTTTKKLCRRTANWLEGAKSPRSHQIKLPVEQSGARYRATVTLDKFEPGFCEWAPFSVNYTVSKNDAPQVTPVPTSPLFWITTNGVTQLAPYEVECEERTWYGKQGLGCRKPTGQYFITMEATMVQINFRERVWFNTPYKKLGE